MLGVFLFVSQGKGKGISRSAYIVHVCILWKTVLLVEEDAEEKRSGLGSVVAAVVLQVLENILLAANLLLLTGLSP